MATKRSTIEIQVLGLEDLRSLNIALNVHDKRILSLTNTYQAFNSSVINVKGGVQQTTNVFNTFNNTVNNTTNAMTAAGRSSQSTLATLLQYRAVGIVLGEVRRGVDDLVKSYADMERQSARISRVTTPQQMPIIRAGIAEEAARTGASIDQIGESYYQLGTRIKDTNTLLAANKVALNLVVGTEADARETTRLMIQVYEQFGDQLGKNVSEAEKWRRSGELIAVSFKGASAETTEIANALKYLGPIAEAAKVPLEQVAGIVQGLSGAGVRGRMAGTETTAFLTNILKNYNGKEGGIVKGDSIFHFDLAKTAQGGIDLYKTMENIVKIANQLPADKAREFLLGVSGTTQSFRFLGAQGVSSMREIRDAIEQSRKALNGETNEAEKLKDQMLTTGQEFKRVMEGAFAALTNLVSNSPLRAFLHGIAEDYREINQAALDLAQSGQIAENMRTGGSRVQQITQDERILNQVIQAKKELENGARGASSSFSGNSISQQDVFDHLGPSFSEQDKNWFQSKFPERGNALFPQSPEWSKIYAMRDQLEVNRKEELTSESRSRNAGLLGTHGDRDPADKAGALIATHLNDAIKTPAFKESCANFVTQILHEAGIAVKGSDSAHVVKDELLKRGAVPVPIGQARAGDVLYWQDIQRRDGQQGNHIGFYEGGGKVRDSNNDVVRDSNLRNLDKLTVLRVPDSLIAQIDPNKAITKKPEKVKDDSEQRARDAERAAQDALRDGMRGATGSLAVLQHDFEGEGKTFAEWKKRAAPYLNEIDAAHLALAQREHDTDYLARVKGGLPESAGIVDRMEEMFKKEAQDAAKKQADFAEYNAEQAQKGPDGELAFSKVLDAQKAAIKAARLGGDGLELRKLLDGNSGPLADYKQQTRQERGEYDQTLSGRADKFLDTYYSSVMKNVDHGLRGLDLAQRPDNVFRSQAQEQGDERNLLNGRVDILKKGLSDLGPVTDDNRDKFEQLTRELEDAKKAVTDFADKVKATDFQRLLKREAAGTDEALAARQNGSRFRVRETEAQRYATELEKLYEIRSILEADVNRIVGKPEYAGKADDVDAAHRRWRSADRQYRDYPQSYYEGRYNETYQRVQGQVVGAGLEFFKGKTSVGQLAQGLGDQIVSTAQTEVLKHLTDPLVNSITKEILSLEGVRQAAENLTDVMQGKAPRNPGAAGSGGAAGGAGGKGKGGLLPGKGNQYLAEGLAAYSVFSQGQQQGSSFGGVLGGAAAGFGIAGVPGAIAGGALNLIGGLFHHHTDPLQDSKTYDPSQYNSPGQFELEAYRYRATGTLPTAKQLGIQEPGNAPVVNVFVDGVKTAVNTQIGNQMSTGNISQTNASLSFHEPQ